MLLIKIYRYVRIQIDIDYTIEEEEVTLSCPNPLSIKRTVTWYKWVENEWTYVDEMNDIPYSIDDNGDLFIEKLDFNHAGEYLCSADNISSKDTYVMSLVVKKRTKAFIEHDNMIVGKSITIRCKVTADPSLTYKVDWKLNDTEMDLKKEWHLMREAYHDTLIIKNAELSDSGTYTCVVSTDFKGMQNQNAIASTTLIVRGPPEAPITHVTCTPSEAIIEWKSKGDNGADIQKYTIEYHTSAEPGKWRTLTQVSSKKSSKFKFSMILRWTNYTFRVIAHNRFGSSPPSVVTEMCISEQDIPYENPRGVIGRGTTPTNMVISWVPVPPYLQNGSGFYYRVCWRQFSNAKWNCNNVTDWRQNEFVVDGLPTFTKYQIQVKSVNDIDEMYRDDIFIGYSGEDKPMQAPTNFAVVNITDFDTATLRWDPVPLETVRGNITRYVIHIWNDVDGQQNLLEMAVGDKSFQTTLTKLRRSTLHYAHIFVENRLYAGPKSDILEFMTPLPDPSSVQSIEAHPLGSSAFLLKWTKPLQINEQLIGYKVYYGDFNGTRKYERIPRINDTETTQAKLDGLNPNTTYRLHIVPITNGIDGKDYFIEAKTDILKEPMKPDRPSLSWKIMSSNESDMKVKVNWIPDISGNPGSHFFVKYRIKGKTDWTHIDPIHTEDFVIVDSLLRSETYEFEVVSVDGDQMAESEVKEVSFDSSSLFSNKTIIIITTVATLYLVLAIGMIRLFFRIKANKRSVREKELNLNNTFKTNKGNPYHINPNEFNLVPNQYTLSQIKPRFEGQLNRFGGTITSEDEFPQTNILTSKSIRKVDYVLENFMNGNLVNIDPHMALDEQADTLPYDQRYEFPREKLELGKQLGTGAFGVVLEAKAYGIVSNEDQTTVAVKTVKKMADNEIFRAFALELKIMIHLGKHQNIVNLLGAVTRNIAERELMIIVEYCEHGNLQSFLVKHRQHFVDQIIAEDDRIDPKITCRKVEATNGYLIHTSQAPSSARSITTTDLVCWSFQIARGMHYLATRKVLHGDLAARNILLCENNVVKICDFGLARSIYKTGNYLIKTERLLPYKWLAPESIGDHVFSTHSDVWSFGIVLWELFSLGAVPYPGLIAGAALFKMLIEGYRMERPDFATQDIYEIMLSCWNERPESRPLFDELARKFSNMMDHNVSEHYISLNEPHSKDNENRLKSVHTELIASSQSQSSQNRNSSVINDKMYRALDETQLCSHFSTLKNSIQVHRTGNSKKST
ncbi:neuroglian-like isoform X2 [Sitodiplosis mosellana]|uniref:neuroglian-like isoform X2 n=1 Tax=Sitodiplosis mosellana TaxID=263140 RepID=UPI002444210E|nr:neuroglian-like isoform X2 [Sitodiplosis mosellana]